MTTPASLDKTEQTADGDGDEQADEGWAPYVPDRAALRALCDGLATGSGVLLRRGWEWVTAEADWQSALTRLGYVAGGVYVGVYALHTPGAAPVVPWVGPGLVTAWSVAAWTVAPGWPRRTRPAPAAPAVDVEDQEDIDVDQDDDVAGASVPSPGPETLLELIRVAADGRAGAHLADILAVGHDEQLLPAGWDDAVLRSELEAAGVPVEQVNRKLPGGRQRTRLGVKVARAEGVLAPVGEEPVTGSSGAVLGVLPGPHQGPPVTDDRGGVAGAA